MKTDLGVFDAHTHIGRWGEHIFFNRNIRPFQDDNATVKHYRDFLDTNKITSSIVVPIYTPEKNSAFSNNSLVVECISRLRNVFGGLWFSPMEEHERYIDETLEAMGNPKLRVLKTNVNTWSGDFTINPETWNATVRRNSERIISYAIERDITFQFHTAYGKANPGNFVNFFKEYGTSVKVQFVHMGLDVWTHFQFVPLFIEWLKKDLNVYCDTSLARGFAVRWLVRELSDAGFGISRVLFASDEPWGDFCSELWKIKGLDIDEHDKQKIMYGNAMALYAPANQEECS